MIKLREARLGASGVGLRGPAVISTSARSEERPKRARDETMRKMGASQKGGVLPLDNRILSGRNPPEAGMNRRPNRTSRWVYLQSTCPAMITVDLNLVRRSCARRCIANSLTLIRVAAATEDSPIG